MSTRFPSPALLMELSVFLKKRKIKALVEWAPRESNKEADALAVVDTTGFVGCGKTGRGIPQDGQGMWPASKQGEEGETEETFGQTSIEGSVVTSQGSRTENVILIS